MKVKTVNIVMLGLLLFPRADVVAQAHATPGGKDPGAVVVPWSPAPGLHLQAPDRVGTRYIAPRVDSLVAMSGYNGAIPLAWKSPGGGIQGYNVYRSSSSGGTFQKIAGALKKVWYRDETAVNGVTYYYAVTAVDGAGESLFSPEASGMARANGYSIVSAWTSSAPTIDGIINPGEWTSAAKTTITYPGGSDTVRLFVMNDGAKLYLAVDDKANRGAQNNGGIGLFFDTNHDRSWPPDGGTINEGVFQAWWNGSPSKQFANYYGVWPDSMQMGPYVNPSGVVSAVTSVFGNLQYEASFDLTASILSLPPNGTFGLFVYTSVLSSGIFTSAWPQENGVALRPFYGDTGYRWAHGPFSFGDITLGSASAATPSATAATNVTTSSFSANWLSSAGAAGYRLDVATDAGFSSFVSGYNNKDVGNVTTLQVTGLSAGTTWHYRVRAYNATGVSSSSSNTITVSTFPNAPAALAGTNTSTTGFTANWSAVAGATSYRLDVASDNGFSSFLSGYNNLDVGSATSRAVSGLTPGTAYYYRVRSVGAGGTSGNSDTITVSTLSEISGVPTALAATNTSTTGFTANWSAVAGATGYRLDVASDNGFSSFVSGYNNLDAGSATSRAVSGLTPGTTYYYRVRGIGPGGASGNSLVITVTTRPAAPAARAATNVGASSFTANWDAVTGAAGYRLDVATDSLFSAYLSGYANLEVGNVTTHLVSGLAYGTAYYYRVSGFNAAGAGPNSNMVEVSTALRPYPSTFALARTTGFTSKASLADYASEDYQLIGLPGNSGELISAFLDGQQGATWEAYWDNGKQGTPQDYYVKYDGSPAFQSTSGRAFWVLRTGDWVLANRTVATAPLDGNREVSIPLTSGQQFNLITNPFDTPIPWSSVAALNGINDSIRTWAGYGWSRADIFEPYQGYLFFNGQNKTSIRVPFDLTALPVLPKPSIDGWRIDVVATCGKFRDETSSFGVSKDSRAGFDRYEQRKPRMFAAIPDVYFDRQDWDGEFNEFATDVRPEVEDLEVWEMKVRSGERKPVDLEFQGVERVPEELAVFLLDESAGRGVDLRETPAYRLTPATPSTVLAVVVGKPELVKAKIAEAVPKEFALEQNYPNPFNPTTTIPVAIARESSVVLEIFNVLGERVRTLCDGVLSPGRHAFQWDGKGDRAQMNASGVYLCRLQSGSEIFLTRKIVFLR